MAQLKGLKRLANKLIDLQDLAAEIRNTMDEKQDWLDNKSEKFQDSEAGQEWGDHIAEVENLISDIENLDFDFIDD